MELQRQIHVKGSIQKISYDKSNEYFKSRPYGSQVAALVSNQSSVVKSRTVLENDFSRLYKQNEHKTIECPTHWGGYCVEPMSYEFWQGRPSRYMIEFVAKKSDQWEIFKITLGFIDINIFLVL